MLGVAVQGLAAIGTIKRDGSKNASRLWASSETVVMRVCS